MPFGNSGFPVRYRAKTHYFGTQPVTNAFRQFGFPRQMLEILIERSGILVTNAFRQFGFPRLLFCVLSHKKIRESPMPFGNSGFPVKF